uniref:Uncharacterized protein n=1 Tax=Neobodo designis TaxID=312471 RepID=A0A7S1QH22_NEODS
MSSTYDDGDTFSSTVSTYDGPLTASTDEAHSSLPPSSEPSPERNPAHHGAGAAAAGASSEPYGGDDRETGARGANAMAKSAAPTTLPESPATSTLDRLSADAFGAMADFCDDSGVGAVALTSRRFARHLGVVADARPGRGYNWPQRALRAWSRLPQHRAVHHGLPAIDGGGDGDDAPVPAALDFTGMPPLEALHMALYLERFIRHGTGCSVAASSSPTPAGRCSGAMNVAREPFEFMLKALDEEEGLMLPCDPAATDAFRGRFEAQQKVATLAALGFVGAARRVALPEVDMMGPGAPRWTGPPQEDPLGTIFFPVFNTSPRRRGRDRRGDDDGAVSDGSDDGVVHIVAVPPTAGDGGEAPEPEDEGGALPFSRHVDPTVSDRGDGDDGDLLGLAEYVAAGRARGAAAPSSARLPGVPLYTKGQLAYHSALLSTAIVSKVQHFYSRWDWRRAVVTRLTAPAGGTAELRAFASMRLGSFPCFRCQLVWLPSGWRSGDIMNSVFNDDPHEPAELFKCGYGRVEMDIRPTPSVAQLRALRDALGLPGAFPLELLWNVVIATSLGDVLQEHVRFLNVQYRTTLRSSFAAAAQHQQQQAAGGR